MVFKSGNRPETVDIFFDNCKLKNVSKFTYLGVTLSANGKFYQAQKALTEQATKALFSLNTLFENVSLHVSEKVKLFDAMVVPILNYGSEIWGFHSAPDIERVHTKFLKQILCVRPQTCNDAVYGELGRVPMSVIRKVRIVKYWFKIMKNPGSLLHRIFLDQNISNIADSWPNKVKDLLYNLGFAYLWNDENVTKLQLRKIEERIYDQYYQSWYAALNISRKLCTYKTFKTQIGEEKYLSCIASNKYRVALTKLRISAHRLEVEEGRYRNIELNQRLCRYCNMGFIENEYHFILICPFYYELRNTCLPRYYCTWPSERKFKALMSSQQTGIVNRLAKFVYLAFQKREHAA